MEIITTVLPLFKEITMQYGLVESVLGLAFLIFVWRLPNILAVLKDWKNN